MLDVPGGVAQRLAGKGYAAADLAAHQERARSSHPVRLDP